MTNCSSTHPGPLTGSVAIRITGTARKGGEHPRGSLPVHWRFTGPSGPHQWILAGPTLQDAKAEVPFIRLSPFFRLQRRFRAQPHNKFESCNNTQEFFGTREGVRQTSDGRLGLQLLR